MRVIIIGSGVAGLTAALDLHPQHDVLVLTKADASESNTRYAQGGVAVVTSPPDSPASQVADTLVAGAGLSDVAAATVLCEGGPASVRELAERGVDFDTTADGRLALGLEAAHEHPRILHVHGDATGAAIAAALVDRVTEAGIDLRARTTVVDVLLDGGRAVGVRLLDGSEITADAVILATGGAGQLYRHTTNPEVATGDGVAIALRAGAAVADVEFYQFHPTSLAAPGNFLISEAVRGEGATLVDADGVRFMLDVHPAAELAPRDVVARGIADQMARQHGAPVRLDATGLGRDFLARRFPTIDASCRRQGFAWDARADPGHARGALLDGRCSHRRLGTHLGPRSVRGRRGRVHRAARRQPARLQLPARGSRLRRARRRPPQRRPGRSRWSPRPPPTPTTPWGGRSRNPWTWVTPRTRRRTTGPICRP